MDSKILVKNLFEALKDKTQMQFWAERKKNASEKGSEDYLLREREAEKYRAIRIVLEEILQQSLKGTEYMLYWNYDKEEIVYTIGKKNEVNWDKIEL